MPSFSSSAASHTGTRGGIVLDGLDEVVSMFTRKAATIRPAAGAVTVRHAGKVAQRMRDTVAIGPDPHHVLDSITSDERPTFDRTTVYADAGPDPRADEGAFVARFLEHGTVRQAPQPFVGPAADRTVPEFLKDLGRIT